MAQKSKHRVLEQFEAPAVDELFDVLTRLKTQAYRLSVHPQAGELGPGLSRLQEDLEQATRLILRLTDTPQGRGPRLQPTDLRHLTQEALRTIRLPEGTHVRLQAEDELPMVPADPSQLLRAVAILFQNILLTLEGTPDVSLRLSREGQGVQLTVSWSHTRGGRRLLDRLPVMWPWDLGMDSVRRIVRAHEGQLSLHYDPEGGEARAAIQLPLQAADDGEADGREALPRDVPAVEVASPTILLVDDDPELLSGLEDILLLEGYDVLSATEVRQALAILDVESVSAVVCDIRLPRQSGLALLREVRRLKPELPALLITGLDFEEHLEEARQLGSEIWPKPLDLEGLLDRLGQLTRVALALPTA